MSFSSLPTEIKKYVSDFIIPPNLSIKEVKSYGRHFLNLSLVNKELKDICSEKLSTLKKIHGLLIKYHKYQDQYENPQKNYYTLIDPKGNPQLLDALFTGCKLRLANSTFDTYNQEIEYDIKEIVKLTPQSVNCILGKLRCREMVTPLAAACFNTNIPVHIIEFLLENGANPNSTIEVEGRATRILDDMKTNKEAKPTERLSKIEELFKKYGAEV